MTRRDMKEIDLYSPIETTGPFAKRKFYYEVPIGSWSQSNKSIDMVILEKKKLIAIEVKISNHKKVIQQAFVNRYYSDYSYVALYHKAIPHMNISLCKKLGIGILEINESCAEIVKAKQNEIFSSECKNYALDYCKSRDHV